MGTEEENEDRGWSDLPPVNGDGPTQEELEEIENEPWEDDDENEPLDEYEPWDDENEDLDNEDEDLDDEDSSFDYGSLD
jgi:hypothetical protein